MSDLSYELVSSGFREAVRKQFGVEQFHYLPETGSTNDDLLDRIRRKKARHLDLVVTDLQRQGRGRRGDRWEAPSGRNLLFSLALKLEEPKAIWCRLPHLAAFVLGKVVESVLTVSGKIQAKWPNDLLFDEKKLAGILVETVLVPEPYAVVGIGLNVNVRATEFPEELRAIATSIYELEGCESSRSFLLGEIISGFVSLYPNMLTNFDEVREWLHSRSVLSGRDIEVVTAEGTVRGIGAGLGEDGELIVNQGDQGNKSILSAERVLFR
jgi:BirA family biotin operon repressor/biotin-[acetyl-CoA-carboxylase] ligase